MNSIVKRLDQFWFCEAPAARLALLRILVGAFSFYYIGIRFTTFTKMATGANPGVYEPLGINLLQAPLSLTAFQILIGLTLLSSVLFALGWRFRWTGPFHSLLLLWLLCYRNSWSMVYHTENLLVLHSLVLGFSRAADALSLDARRGRAQEPGRTGEVDAAYGWPLRLICTVTVLTYFLAGVAKLAAPEGGWSWVEGESMRRQLGVDGLRKEMLGGGAPEMVFTLYRHVELFTAVGVLTMIVEVGAPLALLRPWVGRTWALLALGMHWGILFMMDIKFEYSLSGLGVAAFFPLEKLVRQPKGSVVVLFDGRCGLCQRSRRWAARLDWLGQCAWLNFRDPAVRNLVPQLSQAQLEEEMRVITPDGWMRSGFAAWRYLWMRLPLTCLPAFFLYVPPVPWVGNWVYRQIARNRPIVCDLVTPEPLPPGPWREILGRVGGTLSTPPVVLELSEAAPKPAEQR